jgi:hypothetical protein
MPQQRSQTNSEVSWLKPEQVESMRDHAIESRHPRRDEAIVTILYDTAQLNPPIFGVFSHL